jgi:hypothetical protein
MSTETDAPFALTEWTWFKTQLRLYALERGGTLFFVSFKFDDQRRTVACGLYHSQLRDIFRETRNKETVYQDYFFGWVRSQRQVITKILTDLPRLGTELDLERDVVFEILSNYGTGSTLVCTISGTELVWNSTVFEDLRDSVYPAD